MASNTVKLIGKCSAPPTFTLKKTLKSLFALPYIFSLIQSTTHHLVPHQVTGGSLKESREALEIAETDGRLFCTVGVHPTRCGEFEESGDPEGHFQALLALAKEGIEKGKVVAVGECGLDYDRLQFCPSDIQKKYFEKQFELAEAVKLPMFLHMRAAGEDFSEMLSQNLYRFPGGVTHSFTGTAEEREKLLSIENMFIGINGCSLKTIENLEIVRGIPAERMMIETDSPYCDIKNTHAGIQFVKSIWPSKKKEKYEPGITVKGRNEPCLVSISFLKYTNPYPISVRNNKLVN
ncbi:hypothetical protein D1007_35086 [Hordeum vulgare]|nr:hypothetical protein D1007_35086 [Hordeum vulgare]